MRITKYISRYTHFVSFFERVRFISTTYFIFQCMSINTSRSRKKREKKITADYAYSQFSFHSLSVPSQRCFVRSRIKWRPNQRFIGTWTHPLFFFFFFFFLIEEKLTKDGHFYFSSIKTEWKSSVAQELLPVFPFFPSLSSPLFFFVLASWRQGFIILCKAMRRASVGFPFVYPRIISNARKQKNGNNRRTLLF